MAIGRGPEPKDEEFQSTPENSFFSPTKKRRKEKNEGDQDSALRCREEKKKDKKKSRHLRKKRPVVPQQMKNCIKGQSEEPLQIVLWIPQCIRPHNHKAVQLRNKSLRKKKLFRNNTCFWNINRSDIPIMMK